MKKILLLFIVLVAATIIYLLTAVPSSKNAHYVSVSDKTFLLDGKSFYPIALNYIITMQGDEKGNIWASSFNGYTAGEKYQYTTKDSCRMQLKAEMDLIKEMGFNTVRIVRIGEEQLNDQTAELSVTARVNNQQNLVLPLADTVNYRKYFDAMAELFQLADDAGLKVIFLVNVQPDVPSTEEHLVKVLKRFKDTPAIMAYDLFNEPLYFDKKERDKKDVIAISERWRSLVKTNAPNQLLTIGLEGIREVFEWDPNILDVDFVSLHPYQYEPEQVRNELYWYGKYIKKPWMLGETAIPADNDSVSYEEQRQFAAVTLKQAYNCGALGYSWWQYKDVDWHLFHANFMGVLNWKGSTQTKKPNIPLTGTVKPLVQEFQKFDPKAPKGECICMQNYYNYTANTAFRIIGKMVDENGLPIDGGVILGWNENWTHSYHTITKPDGSFELLSNYPYFHWMASATMHTMIRGEVKPDTAKVVNGIKTIDFRVLKVEKL